MIRSMISLMPEDPEITKSCQYPDSPFIEAFVNQVLKISENHEGLLSDISDPGSLEKMLSNAKGLGEIADLLQNLLNAIRNYQKLATFLSYKQAVMLKEHIELFAPGSFQNQKPDVRGKNKKNNTHQTTKMNTVKFKVL